ATCAPGDRGRRAQRVERYHIGGHPKARCGCSAATHRGVQLVPLRRPVVLRLPVGAVLRGSHGHADLPDALVVDTVHAPALHGEPDVVALVVHAEAQSAAQRLAGGLPVAAGEDEVVVAGEADGAGKPELGPLAALGDVDV